MSALAFALWVNFLQKKIGNFSPIIRHYVVNSRFANAYAHCFAALLTRFYFASRTEKKNSLLTNLINYMYYLEETLNLNNLL